MALQSGSIVLLDLCRYRLQVPFLLISCLASTLVARWEREKERANWMKIDVLGPPSWPCIHLDLGCLPLVVAIRKSASLIENEFNSAHPWQWADYDCLVRWLAEIKSNDGHQDRCSSSSSKVEWCSDCSATGAIYHTGKTYIGKQWGEIEDCEEEDFQSI